MKRILYLCILLTAIGVSAPAATITNLLVDAGGNPVSVSVTFRLLSEPYGVDGAQLLVAKPLTITVGTNGVLNTNLNAGLYSVAFGDYYGGFNILVPADTSNSYSMATIATNLASFTVTNYIPTFPAALIYNSGTAIYSNATAFVLSSYAGISNVLGFVLATNSNAGITGALGYTPATNSHGGITSALGYVPATNINVTLTTNVWVSDGTNSFRLCFTNGLLGGIN